KLFRSSKSLCRQDIRSNPLPHSVFLRFFWVFLACPSTTPINKPPGQRQEELSNNSSNPWPSHRTTLKGGRIILMNKLWEKNKAAGKRRQLMMVQTTTIIGFSALPVSRDIT